MVWCAVSFHRVNGPYVFKDTVNSQWYLLLLKNKFAPGLQKQPAKFNMFGSCRMVRHQTGSEEDQWRMCRNVINNFIVRAKQGKLMKGHHLEKVIYY